MSEYPKYKKRVLVVDDEPMVVDLTCDFLKNAGFEAMGAKDTREALKEMEKDQAGVVLLDIRLPDEDGLTFLKGFKKKYPDVPVVILTGSGYDDGLMQAALRHGASGYISKDTDLENMLSTVKRLMK